MDAGALSYPEPAASRRLLEHCRALDFERKPRPTAEARLEAMIGRELTQRLVAALSAGR